MNNQFTLPLVHQDEFYLVVKKVSTSEEYYEYKDDDCVGLGCFNREKKVRWHQVEYPLGYVDTLHELELVKSKILESMLKQSSESYIGGSLKKTVKVEFTYQKIKRFDSNIL